MKRLLQSYTFIALVFFILGGAAMWAVTRINEPRREQEMASARSGGIFDFIKKAAKTVILNKLLSIEEREDDKFVYYDIKLNGNNANDVQVDVQDGIITISSKSQKRSGEDGSSFSSSSSYRRSFNLPANVDPDQFSMEPEKDKLVVKFPKHKSDQGSF